MTTELIKPMIRNESALLTPKQWLQYYDHLNQDYKSICSALLYSGMRVEELKELMNNKDWYHPSNRAIFLPKSAIKKVKTRHKERHVILTLDGCKAIEHLLDRNPRIPTRMSISRALKYAAKNAGFDPQHFSGKMFRKMFISWMIATGKYSELKVACSAGHTLETMKDHYLGLAFKKEDIDDMERFFKCWGEA